MKSVQGFEQDIVRGIKLDRLAPYLQELTVLGKS